MAVQPEARPPEEHALTLRDEAGEEFSFRPIRALRDGSDVFLLAERTETGTLHVLQREGDQIGLVRDDATLRRVALRLEILRRAMEGELVEWNDGAEVRFLGVFHRGEVEGRAYLLAADLVDPATVLALSETEEGLELLDDRRAALVKEQLRDASEAWDLARPNLEAATVGLRGERIEVREAAGGTKEWDTAGRVLIEGRDLLFLKDPGDPTHAFPVEVKEGGRIEPVSDAAVLDSLDAHLRDVLRQGGRE